MKTLPLLTLTALTVLSFGCKGKEADPKATNGEAIVAVVATKLTPRSFEDWGSYPAELRGISDAVLTAGAGGRVQNVVEVGTWAKAGDALCDIESVRYENILAQAQASVDLTKGELDRVDANVKAGSVGKASLDKAKLDFQGAQVNLLQAKRTFEDSRCQAPFDGIVVSRSIEKFSTIAPGTPTVRIARTDRLEALISLPENDLHSYNKGAQVRFMMLGSQDGEFSGRLNSVDLAVDSRSRTAMARLEIVNRSRLLGPGMAGKALLLRKTYSAAILVPTTAVLRNEDGPFAMVVENGIAKKRVLELGPSARDSVVVLSGLVKDDVLITVGSFRASEGTKVKY